jgi:hypothetical protein
MFRYLFLVVVFIFLGIPKSVSAAIVQPPIVDVQVAPGAVQEGEILLSNDLPQTTVFLTEIQKFRAQDEDGRQLFFPVSDQSDPVSWIRIADATGGIPASGSTHFSYKINVPSTARPGGYSAAVFFSPVGDEVGGSAIRARVGVLFLIHVTGNAIHDARLVSCDTVAPMMSSFFGIRFAPTLPTQFVTRIQNAGDDIVEADGNISVSDVFGHEIRSFLINDAGGRALPHSFRRYVTDWPSNVQPPAFGGYLVTCRISPSNGDVPVTRSFSFWILPWKIVVAFCLVLLFLILVITRYTYRRRV